MTNREAIRILTLERDDWETSHCTPMKRKEAFEMAINALEKEAWKEEHPVSPLQPCNQDDLISRAAAQTELMMKCERYTLARESHGMGHVEWSSDLISVADAMDAIRGLPSAQPEIIRCNECKNWLDIDDGRQKHRMCADIYGEWYCADAERRTDDKTNKGSSC